MEYIIKQYIPEDCEPGEYFESIKQTIPAVITDKNEAIEWAEYYGPGSVVYLKDED